MKAPEFPENRVLRTLGQLIDHVERSLMAQEDRCVTDEGECVYRNPEGYACAVGHLMTEDAYVPAMDTSMPFTEIVGRLNLVDLDALAKVFGGREGFESFLGNMQLVHDDYDPEKWPEKFTELRETYNEYI